MTSITAFMPRAVVGAPGEPAYHPPELCALVLQGEPSVFESETGREGMAEPVGRRRYQMAGIDYDNSDTCQVALVLMRRLRCRIIN